MIKNAARYPRLAAMMTAFGVICGVATHMSYCVAGLAVVITTTPWLFNLLKYAGAVYLVWIGIRALLSRRRQDEHQQSAAAAGQSEERLCARLPVQPAEPEGHPVLLAVFTRAADRFRSGRQAVVRGDYSRPVGHLVALLVFLIQSGPVRRGLEKTQKIVDKLLGGMLIALGIKVALS